MWQKQLSHFDAFHKCENCTDTRGKGGNRITIAHAAITYNVLYDNYLNHLRTHFVYQTTN